MAGLFQRLSVRFQVGVVGALVQGDDLFQSGDRLLVTVGLLIIASQVVEQDAEGDECVAVVGRQDTILPYGLAGQGDGPFLGGYGGGCIPRLGGGARLSGELAQGVWGGLGRGQDTILPYLL